MNPAGGLYDVIDGPDGVDATVRPNQIFAVSLPASALEPVVQRSVVDVCARLFATSYGLRSLDPRHPDYRPHYGGGVRERDSAYHGSRLGMVAGSLCARMAPRGPATHRPRSNCSSQSATTSPTRDSAP